MIVFKSIAISALLIAIVGGLLTQSPSIKATFPKEKGTSGLIFFNRDITYSTSQIYGRILAFNIDTRKETRVTRASDVRAHSWSHGGTRILGGQIRDEFPPSLIVMDADGKNRKLLASGFDIVTHYAQWSADDERIIFWGSPIQAKPRYWAIFDIPSEGGEMRRLSEPLIKQGTVDFTISPDGSQIFFIRNGTLFTMPANGGEATPVSLPLNVKGSLAWSPDGTQIAVWAYSTDNSSTATGIYLMTPDGTQIRLLIPETETIALASSLQWSPDGSQILFIAWNNDNGKSLGIVTLETGDIRTYPEGQGILASLTRLEKPVWSPDGNQIAFSAGSQEFYRVLYRVDREFTHIDRLTKGLGLDSVVEWRP